METLRAALLWLDAVTPAIQWLDVVARGSLVLLAAGLIALGFRRRSAAARHTVWALGLCALVALPVLTWLLPWKLPVLPDFGIREPWAFVMPALDFGEPHVVIEAPVLAPAEAAPPPGWVEIGPRIRAAAPPGLRAPRASAAPRARPAPRASEPPLAMAPPLAFMDGERAEQGGFTSMLSGSEGAWLTARLAGQLFLGIWLFGAILLLGRLVVAHVVVHLLSRRAEPLDGAEWHELLAELRQRCETGRPVRLLRSAITTMPMTWGVTRPVILLPASASEWTTERRAVVLLHELAHVRRRDVLTQALAQIACALYWFNPLVWLAAVRLRAECERACDDWVLRAGARASTYANHLLEMVRSVGASPVPAAVLPMARRRGFEGRLMAILEPDLDRRDAGGAMLVGGGVLVTVFTLLIATMAPARAALPQSVDALAMDEIDAESWLRMEDHIRAAEVAELNARLLSEVAEMIPEVVVHVPAPSVAAVPKAVDEWVQRAPAVAALSAALVDAEPEVRRAAVESLGHLQDPRAIAALSNALRNDRDAEVRRAAAWALGNIESAAGVPALVDALSRDQAVEVRRTAAWALGNIEDASAIEGLRAGVRDADAEVRSQSVWALGEIESAEGVDLLLPLLRDANAEVRKQAAWALGEIESPRAVEGLSAMLRNDTDPEARKQAVWALGEIEDAAALPALTAALRDTDLETRKTAIWAIGNIEPASAPRELIDALRDSDPAVREAAAHALGMIEDRAAVEGLTPLLQDSVLTVRRAAVHALMQIGDSGGVDALVRMLEDPDPQIRKAAAEALGKVR